MILSVRFGLVNGKLVSGFESKFLELSFEKLENGFREFWKVENCR
jgi:hypothetical protein